MNLISSLLDLTILLITFILLTILLLATICLIWYFCISSIYRPIERRTKWYHIPINDIGKYLLLKRCHDKYYGYKDNFRLTQEFRNSMFMEDLMSAFYANDTKSKVSKMLENKKLVKKYFSEERFGSQEFYSFFQEYKDDKEIRVPRARYVDTGIALDVYSESDNASKTVAILDQKDGKTCLEVNIGNLNSNNIPLVLTEQGSFESRLIQLGNEAIAAAKEHLKKIGTSVRFTKEDNLKLAVDSCNGEDPITWLNVTQVVCSNDTLVIIGDVDEKRACDLLTKDEQEIGPILTEEMWCEGGITYAEWEFLLEVIDAVLEK